MGAMHARVAWVQEGHRHQSLGHLADVSRTLADVSFVVFACIFTDVLRAGLKPFTLQVQGVLEPAVLKRLEGRVQAYLTGVRHQLCVLRGLLRVVALLGQHVPQADLCTFVLAYRYSALGRSFPTLFSAWSGLLSPAPSFNGVGLRSVATETAHDPIQTMCLGPTCQCDSILRQRQAAWEGARQGRGRGRGRGLGRAGDAHAVPARVVPCPWGAAHGRTIGVRVPRYVAYPSDEAKRYRGKGPCGCAPGSPCKSYCDGLLSTSPRYSRKDRVFKTPPGMDTKAMFRKVWTNDSVSVCRVSHAMYAKHDDI